MLHSLPILDAGVRFRTAGVGDPHAGPPRLLQVEVGSACNLKCRMCPLTAEETLSGSDRSVMKDVVRDQVLALAARVEHVVVSGFGEPLLSPVFLPLLREIDTMGVSTSFTTNGIAVTAAVVAELATLRRLDSVNVSIDSPDPATYTRIRGGKVRLALRGAGLLADGLPPEVHVSVSSVVMADNVAGLIGFADRLAEHGVNRYVLQAQWYEDTSPEDEHALGELIAEHLPRIEAACNRRGIDVFPESRLRLEQQRRTGATAAYRPLADGDRAVRQCYSVWNAPYIDKDGHVFPCCHTATDRDAILGDVRERTLAEIWTGPEYRRVREASLDPQRLPAYCRRCTVAARLDMHPYRMYRAEILPRHLALAGPGPYTVAVRNTGLTAWTRGHRLLVATAGPRDRSSDRAHRTWHEFNRPAKLNEDLVPIGGVGTFTFRLRTVPDSAVERFQVVLEDENWLFGTSFAVDAAAAPADPLPLPAGSDDACFDLELPAELHYEVGQNLSLTATNAGPAHWDRFTEIALQRRDGDVWTDAGHRLDPSAEPVAPGVSVSLRYALRRPIARGDRYALRLGGFQRPIAGEFTVNRPFWRLRGRGAWSILPAAAPQRTDTADHPIVLRMPRPVEEPLRHAA